MRSSGNPALKAILYSFPEFSCLSINISAVNKQLIDSLVLSSMVISRCTFSESSENSGFAYHIVRSDIMLL